MILTRILSPRGRGTPVLAALVAMALIWPSGGLGAEAADNWKKRCAMCHGKDGKPTPVGVKMGAKDVRSEEVQAKPDEALAEVVAGGSGKMPGFEDQMTAEEISAVIEHVRALARTDD